MPDTPTPVARSPLHPWHAALSARFVERDGWQVVAAYADPEREAAAARAGLGLADHSGFAKDSARASFWVMGPHCDAFLRRLTQLDLRAASFPVNARAATALAGVEALLVRSAELSVPSVRIEVSWDVAEYVWVRMLEEGRDLGITPLGLDALGLLAVGSDGDSM